MNNNRVIHFEVHAKDPVKMAEFYKEVFGWEVSEWLPPEGVKMEEENRYWSIMTAPTDSKEMGINGGIVFRKGALPTGKEAVNAFICTIGVPSVDGYGKKIEKAGGKIHLPKMAVPGMAWLAYYSDIDGNVFGIFEEDKTAHN